MAKAELPDWEMLLAHAAWLQTQIPGAVLTSLVVRLVDPLPYDLTDLDVSEYKGIIAPWNDWRAVKRQCAALADAVLRRAGHD